MQTVKRRQLIAGQLNADS